MALASLSPEDLRRRIKAPLFGDVRYARNPRAEHVVRMLDINRLNTAI